MKIRRVFGLLVGFALVLGGLAGCGGWARGFGGARTEIGRDLVVDGMGNTYTIGNFDRTVDFDPGPGVSNLTSNGSTDVFVVKFDPSGEFVWARNIGGTFAEFGRGLAVDGAGNTYSTGTFSSTVDFDPGPGVSTLTTNGLGDVFVVKLDPDGEFVWARSFGAADRDAGYGLAVDGDGYTYTTGTFSGTVDFDPGPGVSVLSSNRYDDVFVVKLDPNGDFVWASNMGGADIGDAGIVSNDLAVDGAGNTYSIGYFDRTVDFDPGPGVSALSSNGSFDVFVVKLDPNGEFVWARSFGAADREEGYGLAVDGAGYTYTTGYFKGTVDFDPGPDVSNLTSNGNNDAFVVKLDPNGDFVWARSISGIDFVQGYGLAVDGAGNTYSTGSFLGTADFDPGPGVSNLTSNGDHDVFVLKLDPNGDLVWARNVGGAATDIGSDLAVDAAGNVYSTGRFDGTADFDPGPGVLNLTSNGLRDVFVLKLDPNGNLMENTSQAVASPATAPAPDFEAPGDASTGDD